MKLEENYNEGKLHGIQKYYFENGNIKLKKEFDNGVVLGLYEDYYENGALKRKYEYGSYIKRKLWKIVLSREIDAHGKFEYYRDNGQLKSRRTIRKRKRGR